MVPAIRSLPPAFFWCSSITGEAMFMSPESAKVSMTGIEV